MFCSSINNSITWSRRYTLALCQLGTRDMAKIHTSLPPGRSLLGLVVFHQMQLLEPHPYKYSCFARVGYARKRDIHHTLWSSRLGTQFSRESWVLLIDLLRSKPHKGQDVVGVDFRRCLLRRRRCYDRFHYYIIHIPFLRFRRKFDLHWCKFSTVDPLADTDCCCRCQLSYRDPLLHIL